jgi:hypothetical protein
VVALWLRKQDLNGCWVGVGNSFIQDPWDNRRVKQRLKLLNLSFNCKIEKDSDSTGLRPDQVFPQALWGIGRGLPNFPKRAPRQEYKILTIRDARSMSDHTITEDW